MTILPLRERAKELFGAAVAAADPSRAVRHHLISHPLPSSDSRGKVHLIAIGKAAIAMTKEALTHVNSDTLGQACAVTNYENATEIQGVDVFSAGHPVPDENGQKAAAHIIDILGASKPEDMILALISGGGSALVPAPTSPLTLEDKAQTNQVLLSNGYDISEMNLIRQALSDLKGGGLVRLANAQTIRALIISDVIGDNLSVIASGPTTPPLGSRQVAATLLQERGHWTLLPESVRRVLSTPRSSESGTSSAADNHLICSNQQSLEAVVSAGTDLPARVIDGQLQGDVSDAAEQIARTIKESDLQKPQCFVWGGETTVTLKGNGAGGRNQELALRVAENLSDLSGTWVFLSGGTDGRDGPTDAAGGLVDNQTLARLDTAGVSLKALLDNNDSYAALKASGDLLFTGATGTNVADVQIFVYAP